MNSFKLSSVLLVVAFILCPLRCTLGSCQNSDSQEQQSVGCHCCHQQQPPLDSQQPNPAPSDPDESQCGDCLCQGALPLNESDDVAIVVQSFADDLLVTSSNIFEPRLEPQVNRHSSFIPVDASAIAVRAVLSCWTL